MTTHTGTTHTGGSYTLCLWRRWRRTCRALLYYYPADSDGEERGWLWRAPSPAAGHARALELLETLNVLKNGKGE